MAEGGIGRCQACINKDCPQCVNACPELLPENDEALELWRASGSQWRAGGMGVIGLDYPAVFLVADKLDIDVDHVMLHKIQAMEQAALLNQRDKDKADIPGYCKICANAGRNTDCATCDLSKITKGKPEE